MTLRGLGLRGLVTAPFCAELVDDRLADGDVMQFWMPLVHSCASGRGGYGKWIDTDTCKTWASTEADLIARTRTSAGGALRTGMPPDGNAWIHLPRVMNTRRIETGDPPESP